MELGLYTFAETTPDEAGTGVTPPPERMRELVEEAVLAEQVGLDVFGVGEHHRRDFIVSSPAVVLGAIASRTSRIRLTSAVIVLSSDDPVRVFQDFATLDLLSSGRAEIMAGRGSFTESFPLFGFDLSINGHGHVAETTARAADEYWPGHERSMRKLGVERGWPPPTRAQYDALIGPRGAPGWSRSKGRRSVVRSA
jgi:alkanesulfonate monooxygenase SsuD/methylene tetrahydromethanopterin reductase-like flavin-dependent oxidoreductase (luciferase family)